jgi:DNA-binding LacI/PurR family transcriptional regulator
MTRLRRITVIDQAEQDIEARVRAGEWTARLPGFKVLADLVGVSVPTIGAAVGRLANRGILVSQGPRRPFVVAPSLAKASASKTKVRSKYLVIVSRKTLPAMDNWTRSLVIDLMRLLTREGWRCDLEDIDYGSGRNTSRTLDCLRQKHPASHMLFLGGSPAISNWAVSQSGLTVGFLGGKSNHDEVRGMGISITTVYNHILSTLSDLGHKRILVALWDPNPQFALMLSGLHANHNRIPVERLKSDGLLLLSNTVPPAQRREEFLRAFRKSNPTALVVDGLFEFILVWTTLMQLGLKVPADISIVNLMSDDQLDKLPLVSTHYKVEPKFMIREIHAWIRGRPTDTVAGARRAIANWVKGDTLAPARKP